MLQNTYITCYQYTPNPSYKIPIIISFETLSLAHRVMKPNHTTITYEHLPYIPIVLLWVSNNYFIVQISLWW